VGLRLGDIALALQGDWLMMATQLGIGTPEVIKIQKEYGDTTEQVGALQHRSRDNSLLLFL